MAEIVGTITNLSDFLSKTQVCLSVKPNDPQQQIICLEADRKYSIPAFQREVRWDDNNLKMLLYDLSRSSKFLGNIILTIKSDHTCEIIDGQQRITSFVRYLKNEFPLSGLKKFRNLNGLYFKDLDKSLQRRLNYQTLSTVCIEKDSAALKYEIFSRLNLGAVKLRDQEVRNCI